MKTLNCRLPEWTFFTDIKKISEEHKVYFSLPLSTIGDTRTKRLSQFGLCWVWWQLLLLWNHYVSHVSKFLTIHIFLSVILFFSCTRIYSPEDEKVASLFVCSRNISSNSYVMQLKHSFVNLARLIAVGILVFRNEFVKLGKFAKFLQKCLLFTQNT